MRVAPPVAIALDEERVALDDGEAGRGVALEIGVDVEASGADARLSVRYAAT